MASFRKSVTRLFKTVTSFKMSSGNPVDKAHDSPNSLIFPPYFTDRRVIGAPKPYTPQELLTRITQDANAVDYIGKIHVTRISYYKETSLPEHEYLVFKVEATEHKLVNYIKVDRSPQPTAETEQNQQEIGNTNLSHNISPARWPTGSLDLRRFFSSFSSLKDSSFSFGNQDARDMIYVADSQGLKSLIGQGDSLLGEIEVSPGNRPTLEQLIVLTSFVSAYQPQYKLLAAQCYWYAYTIWQLLLTAFHGTVNFDGTLSGAGQTTLIPKVEWHKQHFESLGKHDDAIQVTETRRHADLAAKYLIVWGDFEKNIPTLQTEYGAEAQRVRVREAQADRQ
ncbi:hypothetical protein RSAG8_08819, partial [Rhizoctonia solani AG-8 WAC10335]